MRIFNGSTVRTGCILALSIPALQAQAVRGTDVNGFFGTTLGLPSISDVARQEIGPIPGVTFSDRSNLKWGAGGGFAIPLLQNLYATGEVAYNRLGSMDIRVGSNQGGMATLKLSLLDFGGGVQFRLPVSARAMPYVTGGIGVVHTSVGVGASTLAGVEIGANDLSVNGGGGLYVFVGRRWGIRPEIKVVRIPGETFARTSVGIFYQFGE